MRQAAFNTAKLKTGLQLPHGVKEGEASVVALLRATTGSGVAGGKPGEVYIGCTCEDQEGGCWGCIDYG